MQDEFGVKFMKEIVAARSKMYSHLTIMFKKKVTKKSITKWELQNMSGK